ncbi:putative Acid phosphatase [Helianthus annuus]|nr:putative Acid phosphatase [Helianthus annuus]
MTAMKNKIYTTILLVVYAVVATVNVAAELQRFEHLPTKADGSLDILVIGDWGRRGLYNQSHVAFQVIFFSNLPIKLIKFTKFELSL